MRRSERLIERGLEFRSRQEAAGGRRQNPAWSRPPPPPPRTRTPPHGAAAAMASPSRSRSQSPGARRPPPGLARAAAAPSPRVPHLARDPRPSPAPSPSGRGRGPGPEGALKGSGRGAPSPCWRLGARLTWTEYWAPPGVAVAAEGRPFSALGWGLRARKQRRFRSPSSWTPSAPSCRDHLPESPPCAAGAHRDGRVRGELAAHPPGVPQRDLKTEPARDSVSCWGDWS